MSDEEKKAYEKDQEELLQRLEEEKRKAEEELKLEVLKEQEYDPLAVEKREEEEPEQIEETIEESSATVKRRKLKEEKDEKELLYLLKFLKFLDVPMVRSLEWKKNITERQENFIHTLSRRCFEVDPPELIGEISCYQACKVIDSLLEKDEGRLEITDRQIATLNQTIGMDREKAASLSFRDASNIIWKHKIGKPVACRF